MQVLLSQQRMNLCLISELKMSLFIHLKLSSENEVLRGVLRKIHLKFSFQVLTVSFHFWFIKPYLAILRIWDFLLLEKKVFSLILDFNMVANSFLKVFNLKKIFEGYSIVMSR